MFFRHRERINSFDEDGEPPAHQKREWLEDWHDREEDGVPDELLRVNDHLTVTEEEHEQLRLIRSSWYSVGRPVRGFCIEEQLEAPEYEEPGEDYDSILESM